MAENVNEDAIMPKRKYPTHMDSEDTVTAQPSNLRIVWQSYVACALVNTAYNNKSTGEHVFQVEIPVARPAIQPQYVSTRNSGITLLVECFDRISVNERQIDQKHSPLMARNLEKSLR